GRLTKIKNQGLALRALRRARINSKTDLRLAFFGDGEDREVLASLARELGVSDRVLFCGWEGDRARIFCDLDATCISSLNEGTPVCLIESLAAGVPVISTRVGGVTDVVRQDEDGFLVESENEEALASAFVAISSRARGGVRPERSAEVRATYAVKRLTSDI